MDGVPVIQAAYSDVTGFSASSRERDSTYDSIPGGVAKSYQDTAFLLEANDNFFQMLGTDRTTYKGTLSAVAPGSRRNRNPRSWEAAETDTPVDIEYRCRRFDNEQTIWIHLIARFVENAHGAKSINASSLTSPSRRRHRSSSIRNATVTASLWKTPRT